MANLYNIEKVRTLRGLKIFLWNIRSLYPKIDIVREFIHDVGGVDVLCVNETWLKPTVPDGLVEIKDFLLVRNDCAGKRGGGDMYLCEQTALI